MPRPIVGRIGQLTDGAAGAPCHVDIGRRDRTARARDDIPRVDTQPERLRAQNGELCARVEPVNVHRRIGFRVAAGTRIRQGLLERTADGVHSRQYGVGRAIQDGDDARDAIAGQTFADAPDDRHGAADRCLEAQLAPLTRRDRQQPRSVNRHHLFVRSHDRFACQERGANPVRGRFDAAHGLNDHVGVARQQIVELCRPDRVQAEPLRPEGPFQLRAAVADVREDEAVTVVTGKASGDGGSHGAQAEDGDATISPSSTGSTGCRAGTGDVK